MSVVETDSADQRSESEESTRAVAPVPRLWRLVQRITSLPALTIAFVVVTALAMGPSHGIDQALHKPYAWWFMPVLQPFFQDVLDRIAGQAVDLPVLALVAIPLAWRRRTWRPILCGTAAEFGFLGFVGLMKLGFARPAPGLDDPSFFHGGVLGDSWHGISYPSGHAAEAVIFYGTAVYLIARYSSASPRTVRLLGLVAALITWNAVFTSFYLGWHWVTDLVGGVIAGGMLVRAIVQVDTAAPADVWPRMRRAPVLRRVIGERRPREPADR